MSETLEKKINQRMKDGMRAKERDIVTLMRMIKAKVLEHKTSKQYKGEEGDALWLPVIERYVKSSQKALTDYKKLGEKGREHAEQITWEIKQLEIYLPKKADEATTRLWVEEAIELCGGAENANMGMVMGRVMKSHKAEVNPQLVRQLVGELLA